MCNRCLVMSFVTLETSAWSSSGQQALCTRWLGSRCTHLDMDCCKTSRIFIWAVQVEQERFVVQPFSMLNGRRSTDNVDSAADSPAPEERKATASPR